MVESVKVAFDELVLNVLVPENSGCLAEKSGVTISFPLPLFPVITFKVTLIHIILLRNVFNLIKTSGPILPYNTVTLFVHGHNCGTHAFLKLRAESK